jgi:uncharacterized membrane protein
MSDSAPARAPASGPPVDPRDRVAVLVHYYRAMVGRADLWRSRMDATTHWAIGVTAGMVSFALGEAAVPHYVVHIASLLTLSFLFLEARRLTFYHLWQQRVLLLERGLVGPALGLAPGPEPDAPFSAALDGASLRDALAPHLGRTVPTMSIGKAAARRLRRVYLYLFAVQLLAWGLKLALHPLPAVSAKAALARASVGAVPGPAFALATGAAFLLAAGVAAALGGVSRDRVLPR